MYADKEGDKQHSKDDYTAMYTGVHPGERCLDRIRTAVAELMCRSAGALARAVSLSSD